MDDHINSSDAQFQVFESLKNKMDDLETNLQREKNALFQEQVKTLEHFVIKLSN